MTTVHRPPRVREIVEVVDVELPSPPTEPRNPHRTPLTRLMLMSLLPALLPPVVLGLATWALGQSSTVIITSVAMAGGMGVAVVVTVLMSRRDDTIRIRAENDEYEAKMARYQSTMRQVDARCAELVAREKRILEREFPDQGALDGFAHQRDARLWERRRDDDDFLSVRVGVGQRPTAITFKRSGGAEAAPLADAIERTYGALELGPITISLHPNSAKGVVGANASVDTVLRHVTHQVAHQHSPADVRLAVFSRDEEFCGWAKWLPHCRLSSKAETVSLVARTGVEASAALRAIMQELSSRPGDGVDGWSYVIIADGRSWDSLPGRLERWLTLRTRVCLITAEETFEHLPGDCEEVLALTGEQGRVLRRIEPGTPRGFTPAPFDDLAAMQSALAMADLTEAGAGIQTPIPRSARLMDLLGSAAASADTIAAAWAQSRKAFRLAAPIGIGPNDQTVELDLRKDGPHGLLAGTTGSGKSELLQSLVASFSVRIPPDLLQFILFDYKGGSAFSEVAGLPHVVGVVSDLDERIARRALESLRAEMRRREHLLATSTPVAANITEYQTVRRTVPLANLVIIIDEFHRLVTEQPEFIEEMVRIAQQGRSLGVHLILSTQKPSGVVTDQIRANTNFRIALRVTDEADSRDVLGSEEASGIPRDVPGRLYIRVGTEPLRACQAGRISGLVPERESDSAVSGRPFLEPVRTRVVRRNGIAARRLPRFDETEAEPNDDIALVDERERLVAVVREATRLSRLPQPNPPWQEPLPSLLPLQSLAQPAETPEGLVAAVGLVDEPETQAQHAWLLNLHAGHICIAGSANTGKTTALLTLGEAFATRFSTSTLQIYGIDFAGGDLNQLEKLPHCGGVAAQHELPSVRWVLQALKDFVGDRLAAPDTPGPQIFVLIDNFSALWNTIQDSEGGQELIEDLVRVMDVGRAVGVTFAITVERPDMLRSNLLGMMTTRLALPMVDAEGYAALGLSKAARAVEPIAGRALLAARVPHEVQLAWPSHLKSDEPWNEVDIRDRPLKIAPLPQEVSTSAIQRRAPSDPSILSLGLREGTHSLFTVQIHQSLPVLGPRRTGRSNTLAVILSELRRRGTRRAFVVNPRRAQCLRTAAETWGEGATYAERAEEVEDTLAAMADCSDTAFAKYGAGEDATEHWAVIIDDFDVIQLTGRAGETLEKLVLRGVDVGASVYIAADTQALRASYPSGAIRTLLNQRTGILLGPQTNEDFDLLGVRGRPSRVPPGRGWWCEGGGKTAVQVGWG